MRESILKLREQGYTYNQIVNELGCAKSTVAYHCGRGVKDKGAERTREKRSRIRAYIQSYKNGKSCADCKVQYPYYVMDFDHLPENGKSFDIAASSKHHTLDDVKKEIEKCEVVCANCHRIRSWKRLLKTGHSTLEGTG